MFSLYCLLNSQFNIQFITNIELPSIDSIDSSIIQNVSQIYTSDGITLLLLANKSLYGFGRNDYHQLSSEDTLIFDQPVLIDENVTKCGLGYRFIAYIKNDQLQIKGLFYYTDLALDDQILNLYVSSFTILIITSSNNYYYLGKNPKYITEKSTLYSSTWRQLDLNHTVKSISTQQEIITIIDTNEQKHLYGLQTQQIESEFKEDDIVSTNNKGQVKYLSTSGLITVYGDIMQQLGTTTFDNVTTQDLKDICLMNNEIAFIYNNGTADIYNSNPDFTHVQGLAESVENLEDFTVSCNNDQFTLITTIPLDSQTAQDQPQQPEEEQPANNNNKQSQLAQNIIMIILIVIAVGLLVAAIIMLIFVKTNKLDKQLGPKVYVDGDKQSKGTSQKLTGQLKVRSVQQEMSTANLENMNTTSVLTKNARNNYNEQQLGVNENKQLDIPQLPRIQNQQMQKPVHQNESGHNTSMAHLNTSIDANLKSQDQLPKLSLVNTGQLQLSQQQSGIVPSTTATVKKTIKKKKVVKKSSNSINQKSNSMSNTLDNIFNNGVL